MDGLWYVDGAFDVTVKEGDVVIDVGAWGKETVVHLRHKLFAAVIPQPA